MLIDRYAPEDVFAPVPELAGQTDPELKALDVLLDDDQLFGQVKADLARRFPTQLIEDGIPRRWRPSCGSCSLNTCTTGASRRVRCR
jgi:hypothetical protein